MTFKDGIEAVGKLTDATGVAITAVGVVAVAWFGWRLLRPAEPPIDAYRELRRNVGRFSDISSKSSCAFPAISNASLVRASSASSRRRSRSVSICSV